MTAKDRKLAIVKAALPLFARKGFAETTTKELARAAGVSEPLLYKHFPSKEALYTEIQNYSCQATDTIAQRLADHRSRRSRHAGNTVTPIIPPASASARSSRIAATVAERARLSGTPAIV